jgi:hypothetical protein
MLIFPRRMRWSRPIEQMFGHTQAAWTRETEERGPAVGLAAYIDGYLSAAHRDSRMSGCPMAALAADLPRLSPLCRRTFAAGVQRLTDALADHLKQFGYSDAQSRASSVLSEMTGAALFGAKRVRSHAIRRPARGIAPFRETTAWIGDARMSSRGHECRCFRSRPKGC